MSFPSVFVYRVLVVLFLLSTFILGAAIGSFLNVVIDRVPRSETILGRSYCDHCKRKLTVFDLLPIISFLTLRGKCRYCKEKISLQYPLVEVLTGFLLTMAVFDLIYDNDLFFHSLLYRFIVVSSMVVIAIIDLKLYLIPTTLVLAVSLVSLFYNYFVFTSFVFVDHIIAAFLGALFFLAIFVITFGKGMGQGDIVLAFLIGMVLGIEDAILAIFLGFLSGAVISLILVLLGKKGLRQVVPFGPFLVLGFLISFLWGSQLINWYLLAF